METWRPIDTALSTLMQDLSVSTAVKTGIRNSLTRLQTAINDLLEAKIALIPKIRQFIRGYYSQLAMYYRRELVEEFARQYVVPGQTSQHDTWAEWFALIHRPMCQDFLEKSKLLIDPLKFRVGNSRVVDYYKCLEMYHRDLYATASADLHQNFDALRVPLLDISPEKIAGGKEETRFSQLLVSMCALLSPTWLEPKRTPPLRKVTVMRRIPERDAQQVYNLFPVEQMWFTDDLEIAQEILHTGRIILPPQRYGNLIWPDFQRKGTWKRGDSFTVQYRDPDAVPDSHKPHHHWGQHVQGPSPRAIAHQHPHHHDAKVIVDYDGRPYDPDHISPTDSEGNPARDPDGEPPLLTDDLTAEKVHEFGFSRTTEHMTGHPVPKGSVGQLNKAPIERGFLGSRRTEFRH